MVLLRDRNRAVAFNIQILNIIYEIQQPRAVDLFMDETR